MQTCCRSCAQWCGRCAGRVSVRRRGCRSGFARVEAVAIGFVGLVLAAMLLASGSYERRTAMLNRDLANLRQIGAWTFMYASDYKGLYPTFSAVPNSIWPDLRATASGVPKIQAVGHAIDIIRRRTGRETFALPSVWIPHVYYTHLVLADYAQRDLPDTTFVSTGDKHRLNWLDDPINKHDKGFWQPFQNPQSGVPEPTDWRWPYSASFQTPPAWYHKNRMQSSISQTAHNRYSVPSSVLFGGQPLAEVAFPAQKVMVHDYGAWHFSRQAKYFASETAHVAIVMGDGGASVRLTSDSNEGWNPIRPSHPDPSMILYRPSLWEPPGSDDGGYTHVKGHYRWTRGGIKGRDFDGPEIDTGQK